MITQNLNTGHSFGHCAYPHLVLQPFGCSFSIMSTVKENRRFKLTESNKIEISELYYKNKMSAIELAKKFLVSKQAIYRVVNNEKYHCQSDESTRENWRQVKGWNSYFVSDSGFVKSYKKNKLNGRLLTIHNHKDGYLTVDLSIGRKAYQKFVHRLVAEAFIPNPNNKKQVNHIDGDKRNNHVSNLEWSTRSENMRHAVRIGLKKPLKGSKNPAAKLSESDVLKIRKEYSLGGIGQIALGVKYGVSQAVISDVLLRKRWKHI